jgi:hypothetical protein
MFREAHCDTNHYLAVAEFMEILAVSKQEMHIFHMERMKIIRN